MSSWASVLQQLAELDPSDFEPDAMAEEQLREFLPLAHVGINRLSAKQTRAVGAGEARQVHTGDGMTAMKSWLIGHCRLSGRDAAGVVRAARRLKGLPALEAAYAAGSVTPAHVAAITTGVTPARVAKAADLGIDLDHTDRILTQAALALGPQDTAQAVRRWVLGVDPDGTLDDDAGRLRVFRLAVSSGGRTYLSGHLDPVGAETVHAALEAVMNGPRPAGDRRSHPERRGTLWSSCAVRPCTAASCPSCAANGRTCAYRSTGSRCPRSVGCPASATCPSPGRCPQRPRAGSPATPGCPGSSPGPTACPGSLPMDVGQEQRSAPSGIRRAVEERDLHCVFAGCTAPPAWCDFHHVDHWAWGGETPCDNGALICERHHTAVHEGGFTIA